MKVCLAQINTRVGDVARNLQRSIEALQSARTSGAELVLFPELSLMGYPPRDLLDYRSVVDANLRALESLAAAAQGLTVVCGFVECNPSAAGRPFFNAAAVLKDGKHLATYRKRLLPYYDIFDEPRYFEAGGEPLVVDVGGERLGITICEDVWNVPGFLPRPYVCTALDELTQLGVTLLVNLSASPFSLRKTEHRLDLFREISRKIGIPAVFCNQVAGQDEILFDGGSFALGASGELLAAARVFEEELLFVDTKKPAPGTAVPWPRSEPEWLYRALSFGLRDYVKKCGGSKVCLGLSGGIDSSVVAALAEEALGKLAVSGVALPTRFTSRESLEDARELASHLGLAFREIAVEGLFESFEHVWRATFGRAPSSLTSENLQPRIRMTLLMAIANEEGRFLLNTSNKSEISSGYATLYGDAAGALAVIGDLTKRQVYDLARYINRNREVIPQRVLDRPPTAELRENQTDQDTLPPYDLLDPIVEGLIEQSLGPAELEAKGLPPAAVRLAARLHATSEYKRRQLPPVLRVSNRAFGVGRRMPIAAGTPD